MFLLDTNVLSELRRPHRADPNVAEWVRAAPAADLYISVINLLELEIGALSIRRRDETQGAILRAWIDSQVLPSFQGRIFPVDTAVAQRCALLHVPDPKAERDALIAATALVHRMTVVTRNVRHFAPMGVEVFNPWES